MSYSFNIKTSIDLHKELLTRLAEYDKDKMSSANAVICSILCWHVVEWIYQEYSEKLEKFKSNRKFQDHLKSECISLS